MRTRTQDLDVRIANDASVHRAGAARASWRPRPTAPAGRSPRSARRMPSSSMTSGATRPPAATPSVRIASKPANMRARTVSSASRASSVKPPTSISALPMPTRPSRTIAAACSGTTPIRASGAPNSAIADAEPAGESATSDHPEREDRAEHATCSDGRIQDTDARISRVQQVDCHHHCEHGQAAARERLHHPEPRDQPERAIGRDRREALEHLAAAAARWSPLVAARHTKRDDDQTGQQRRTGARGEDCGRSARRQQDGGDHRAAERGERVQHAANGVRARQLLRRLRQRGQQRRVRRSKERHGDRGDDGEAVGRRRPGPRQPSPPQHIPASRRGRLRRRPRLAHDEPGRPSSPGTARAAPRSPCGRP